MSAPALRPRPIIAKVRVMVEKGEQEGFVWNNFDLADIRALVDECDRLNGVRPTSESEDAALLERTYAMSAHGYALPMTGRQVLSAMASAELES